jgi:hypothetical protein
MIQRDGWVFFDDDTEEEVGFAEPSEYRNAEHAINEFGRSYGDGDFSVYFRVDEKLYFCAMEDTSEEFLRSKI